MEEDNRKLTGARMKEWAKAAGLTAYAIADELQVRAPTVYRWWSGLIVPRPAMLARYCGLFGRTAGDVYAPADPEQRAREIALEVLTTWADTFAAGGSMEEALQATTVDREVSPSAIARLSAAEEEIREELASFSGGAWGALSNEEKRAVLRRLMDELLPADDQ